MKPIRIAGPLLLLGLAAACSSERPPPETRPLVISTGARLRPTSEAMAEVEKWLLPQLDSIRLDPGFLVEVVSSETDTYLWNRVEVVGSDTVRVTMSEDARGAAPAFEIYAHLHLMRAQGRLGTWLPLARSLRGFALERAFVERAADAWTYGRSVFGFSPYQPLEEVIYAKDAGQLEALLLTLRAEEFPAERSAWLAREPQGEDQLRRWYRDTFDREIGAPG
jgi:hypothetical protein